MSEQVIQQAMRMLTGHCPECGMPTVVLNNYESWPLIRCGCGHVFTTTEIANYHRIEYRFGVSEENQTHNQQRGN